MELVNTLSKTYSSLPLGVPKIRSNSFPTPALVYKNSKNEKIRPSGRKLQKVRSRANLRLFTLYIAFCLYPVISQKKIKKPNQVRGKP